MPPHPDAELCQDADADVGPDDGRLGGADQSTKPDDRRPFGDALTAELFVRLRTDCRSAKYGRFEHRFDESVQVLGKCRGAVAKSLGRRNVLLGRGSCKKTPRFLKVPDPNLDGSTTLVRNLECVLIIRIVKPDDEAGDPQRRCIIASGGCSCSRTEASRSASFKPFRLNRIW
jgi:hypothetical protein